MPIALVGLPPISDDALERIGRVNEGWTFERDDDGNLAVSPTYSSGAASEAAALYALQLWRERGAGGACFGSSTGFKMASGAVRSPDASWVSDERIATLTAQEREKFWPLCPDVVIEIGSETDSWSDVVAKIEMYACNGARYALAIDPFARATFALGEAPEGLTLDIDASSDRRRSRYVRSERSGRSVQPQFRK